MKLSNGKLERSAHSMMLVLALVGALLLTHTGVTYAQTEQVDPADPAGDSLHPALVQALVSPGFSYRGRIVRNGTALTGIRCDFEFRLWDAVSGGQQIGNTQAAEINLSNGYFTILLNSQSHFGATPFDGAPRFLETQVKCPGDSTFSSVGNRVAIYAVPYALGLRPGALIAGEGSGKTLAVTAERGVALRAESQSGNAIEALGARGGAGIKSSGFFFGPAALFDNATTYTATVTIFNGNASGGGKALDILGQTNISTTLSNDAILDVENRSIGPNGTAVRGENWGAGNAVVGIAYHQSEVANGVYGVTHSSANQAAGVLGEALAGDGGTIGVFGVNHGHGEGAFGVAGLVDGNGFSVGVTGDNRSSKGFGILGVSRGGAIDDGETIQANGAAVAASAHSDLLFLGTGIKSSGSGGGFIPSPVQFAVDATGAVFARGSYGSIKADFAELVQPGDDDRLEPGSVIIVNPEGHFVCSEIAYDYRVVGVYSTDPAFLAGYELPEEYDPLTAPEPGLPPTDKVPLAILGIVPVKVTGEDGPIQPGDRLVSASRPCHAKRDLGDPPSPGAYIGKALEAFDAADADATGVIQVLVSLQ